MFMYVSVYELKRILLMDSCKTKYYTKSNLNPLRRESKQRLLEYKICYLLSQDSVLKPVKYY